MPVAQKYKKQPNAMDLLTIAGQQTNKVKPGAVAMPVKQEKKPVVQQPVNLSSMPMFDRGIVPSYGQRNIKNVYGGTAPMGSPEQGIEMQKMGTKKVQENIATNKKDVRNYTIEGVINKMDTGEPVTIQELRTMAKGANEDDLWDAIDTAMAEGAKFEGLNREKPVEVSGVDKLLRNIPGVTTAQQTMRGAQSGVLKGGLGILQGVTDAGGWLSAQAEKINPFNPNAKSFSELFSTPESRQANYEKQKQFSDTASTYITENVRDPLVDRFNKSVATSDRESLPFTIGEEAGKIGTTMAATLPLGGAGAFSKIPLVARMALGAGEGIVGNALYNKASGAEYSDNAGLAGGIGALVPAGGALLGSLGRVFGKNAEALAVKGLLNAGDAKKIVQQLAETGQGDVGSLGRWALEKGIAGKSEQGAISALKNIATSSRSTVKSVIDDVGSRIGPIGKNIDVQNAMTMVAKKADSVNASAGFNAVDMTEINALKQAATDGTLTLPQIQRSKELIDEFVSIYKKSGDVADSALADAGASLRNRIKNFIEDTVDNATDGSVNIRGLNRDTAVANTMLRGIETKSVANSLRQYAMQSTLGSIAGSGGQFDPTNPEWIGRVIVGALMGRAAGSIMSNPRILGNIARIMDTLSFGTRNSLLQYIKNPKTSSLTDDAIEEISKAKTAIENMDEVKAVVAKTTKANPLEPIMSKAKTATTKAKTTKNPLSPIIKNDTIDNASSAVNPTMDTVSAGGLDTTKKPLGQVAEMATPLDKSGFDAYKAIGDDARATKAFERSQLPNSEIKSMYRSGKLTKQDIQDIIYAKTQDSQSQYLMVRETKKGPMPDNDKILSLKNMIAETKPLKNTPLAPVTKQAKRTYTNQERDLMASELSQRFSMNKNLISKWIEKESPDFGEIAMALGKRDNDYIRKMQESIFSMAR